MTPTEAVGVDEDSPAVSPDDDLRCVASLFLERSVTSLRCVDTEGRVVGIVTSDAVAARLSSEDKR